MGTSASEVLHFVSIPADAADESLNPTYMFATRREPQSTQGNNANQGSPGVQQILPLSGSKKVCILCNNTLTFYSLPELSPAFNTIVSNCTWVGGIDLNSDAKQDTAETVMICIKSRIRLVRIGDAPVRVKDIEFPGCLASARRENFACVADSNSYSLLDVENKQKITLFPISSLDESSGSGRVEDISHAFESRTSSNSISGRPGLSDSNIDAKPHNRSTSLGTFVAAIGKRQGTPISTSRERQERKHLESTERASSPLRAPTARRSVSTSRSPSRQSSSPEKSLPPPPEQPSSQKGLPTISSKISSNLKPHIVSPSASEFLLTTGTTPTEPGVGLFVNLDGDVVRGTLQFSRYPTALVVDMNEPGLESSLQSNGRLSEGHILAAMPRPGTPHNHPSIEIQKWSMGGDDRKEWVDVPVHPSLDDTLGSDSSYRHGLGAVHTTITVPFPEVGASLRASRLKLPGDRIGPIADGEEEPVLEDWESRRNKEEAEFGRRLGGRESNIVVWSGDKIWWIVRNPLAMRLDAAIHDALGIIDDNSTTTLDVNRNRLIEIITNIRGQEATTETEFLSLEYIRQKISLILFCDFILQPPLSLTTYDKHNRIIGELLMESSTDPRVILTLVPLLREEITEGSKGIWIHSGLVWVIEHFWSTISSKSQPSEERVLDLRNVEIIDLLKRYLFAWRQRKGFGSTEDEAEVSQTVDAAILHLLLHSDKLHLGGSAGFPSSRAELYSLVDAGLDCFDRAVSLLENYQRLFVLSRLYGGQKMAGKVLHTWRRIIDGETDAGNELGDGENEMRKYLVKIRDPNIFHEYGVWLATRNPALGVQVYTDDNSKVKLPPHEVVALLQEKAPEAVKVYLEHLVFGKKNFQYANDLISYYLDSVLAILSSSEEAKGILSKSYETYRALQSPKPTYRQFITDNALSIPWWHDRLRLLELLGGSHGAEFSYDVEKILSRIEPFEQSLVPESIILDGRQGRHHQALRLLIHGLGDYHTAISYCLLNGASIFYPASGPSSTSVINAAEGEDQQEVLFGYLLGEFLRIEDMDNRLERTSELLDRFGSWYDLSEVLCLIPESWSVDHISGFLVSALRRLVQEKNEVMITKALSGAENLQVAAKFVEKCSELGPQVDTGL